MISYEQGIGKSSGSKRAMRGREGEEVTCADGLKAVGHERLGELRKEGEKK